MSENYLMIEGKKIELPEDIINQLKGLITKEKEITKKMKEEKPTGWEEIKKLGKYYYITEDGNIIDSFYNIENIDDRRKINLNMFSLESKAEEIRDKQLLERKIKKFADENNEPINSDQYTWSISYDTEKKEIITLFVDEIISFGEIYFSSEELANEAIKLYKDELTSHFKKVYNQLHGEDTDYI